MEIKQEHRAILEATKPHFETAKHGWVQDVPNLLLLEHIYHTYLDHRFVLTTWCKDCVIKMLQRLGAWYEKQELVKPTTFEGTVNVGEALTPHKMLFELEQKQNTNENTRPRKRK